MTKVAILLATYNGQDYLMDLLKSLEKQTNTDFVLYAHDDGSDDETVKLLKEFSAKEKPFEMEIIEGPMLGSAKANFLWMLSQVKADFYFLCDQDDVWVENKVELALSKMKGPHEVKCVFSDMYVADKDLNVLADSFITYLGRNPKNIAYTQIMIDNPAAGCTMCFTRALRDKAIKLQNLENIEMHDVWILVLAAIYGEIEYIDRPLVYYRQTGKNVMGAKTETKGDKIKRNLANLVDGSFMASKKEFIRRPRILARELIKLEDLPEKEKSVLTELSSISHKPKFKRVSFYKKNNLTRESGNFWMRLFV